MDYRHLTSAEIAVLESQYCHAADWNCVMVKEGFSPVHIAGTRFSGEVRLGVFEKDFKLPGGMTKHSGIFQATLHNVTIGDNCCIENVKNYIANYEIGDGCFIENVDILLTDGESTFGNGVEVAVMNETGGREVMIYDRLSAQQAYVMALWRHKAGAISKLREMILDYCAGVRATVGRIGTDVVINYEIRPYGAVGEGSIPRTMRLSRIDGDWKIVSLE